MTERVSMSTDELAAARATVDVAAAAVVVDVAKKRNRSLLPVLVVVLVSRRKGILQRLLQGAERVLGVIVQLFLRMVLLLLKIPLRISAQESIALREI